MINLRCAGTLRIGMRNPNSITLIVSEITPRVTGQKYLFREILCLGNSLIISQWRGNYTTNKR